MENKIHQGRNIKRFREMLGIKQEMLAHKLGDDWNQRKVSLLEQKETIEPDIRQKVAGVLSIPAQAIENFDEQAAITYFNSFNDNSINNGAVYAIGSTFNTAEKWLEILEENKHLYERLLESERERIKLLEAMLKK